jgi:short-subunit dehydrogenase
MTEIAGTSAAVTGAASGIGRALAEALATRRCDLALADRNEAPLVELAKELRSRHGRKVSVHGLDVSRREEVEAFAKAAIAEHPRLNIVFNNAGVALFGRFDEISLADMEWLIAINFWGVIYGTHAFLPHLRQQPVAHIVNTSSVFGLIAPPGQTAYAASKFAVRGFSESLRHELAETTVRVSVVHPGGVATPIARNARVGAAMTDNERRSQSIERFDTMVQTQPPEAAERIIQGVLKNEPRILIGKDARRMDIVQRLKPGTYWASIQRQIEKMAGGKSG